MRTPLATALALTTACTTAPSTPATALPEALQPYAEAARFLAPGFRSYLFSDTTEPDFTSETERYLQVRVARCGSDFEKPREVGAGRSRGVEVRDYGAQRIRAPFWQAGLPTSQVHGVPVWLDRGDGMHFDRALPLWIAVVDERFHVRTHDRDQLEAALARTGRLDEIMQPFAALPWLPATNESVLCLLPRPEDTGEWSRPLPVEPMVIAHGPAGRQLMLHRQPLPVGFLRAAPTGSRTIDGWIHTEAVWTEAMPAWNELVLLHWFGLMMFV